MKNRLILLTVIGVALAGGTYVRAQFGDKPSKLDVVKLKDDLFVIHNDYVPGNTTVMVTNEGVIMVDDKFEIDSANILAEVKKITNQPVKYVINTHHHGDHSGGNAKLQATATRIPLPDDRSWSGAITGPVVLLAHGDWSRWNRFFKLQMSPFINRKVQSISFDATNTTLAWSLNPARFHTADLVGVAAGDMTVSTSPDQQVFTINFAPGSFGRGDSFQFGMSLFTALAGSTQIVPDRLRDMKVTVTLEGGQTFTSTVFAGFKLPINRFTGFGLVNADAAVKAVTRR